MPEKSFRELLEQNLLKRLKREFHITLKDNRCHPSIPVTSEAVEEEIKQKLDWLSVEALLDDNISALGAANALPSPAKKPFVGEGYDALDAIPGLKEAFNQKLLASYQTDSSVASTSSMASLASTASDEGSTDSGSEQSFRLSPTERAQAHQHFVAALAAKREVLDTRVYHTDDRGLRRHDSLTRILSFGSRNSVCTAVTVYDNCLIVAANSSGQLSSDVLAAAILTKLNVLKHFLDVADTFFYEDEAFQVEVDRVAGALIQQYGISGTSDELKQALKKLYRSSQDDSSELLASERELLDAIRFTDRLTVLLPSWKIREQDPQVDAPGLKIYRKHSDTEPPQLVHIHTFDPELQFSGTEKIASFHAEQLLTVYLEGVLRVNLRNADGQLIFGISKLTCADCARAMASRPGVRTRGTSGATYDAAAYITSPGQSGTKRTRPTSSTNPAGSPPDSSIKAPRTEASASISSGGLFGARLQVHQKFQMKLQGIYDDSPDESSSNGPPLN